MSIYTGFFDSHFDEASGTYDHSYDSTDFIDYFSGFIGSGVCVYNNMDSMKVFLDSSAKRVLVNPGYLFIQGYWLKNDGPYTLNLSNLMAGSYVVYAELDLGNRLIRMGIKPKLEPEEYINSLILARVQIADGGLTTVEDTRDDENLCGLIDSAGNLSAKVTYLVNYIDTEIDSKLNQIQEDLNASTQYLNQKIVEADAAISKIGPPEIGVIKFSASQDMDDKWLRCDGSFINELDYPELVAALGKLTPGVEDFKDLISPNTIPRNISNGLILENRFWVFCQSNSTLYGISLTTGDLKTITVTGTESLSSSSTFGVYLSIVNDDEIYIAQRTASTDPGKITLLYSLEFNSELSSLELTKAKEYLFSDANNYPYQAPCPLYVVENPQAVITSGVKRDRVMVVCMGSTNQKALTQSWPRDSIDNPSKNYEVVGVPGTVLAPISIFNRKNQNELIGLYQSSSYSGISIISKYKGIYENPANRVPNLSTTNKLGFGRNGVTNLIGGPNLMQDYKIEERKISIAWVLLINSSTDISPLTITPPLLLPQQAKVFYEAATYLENQNLWTFFVGTGLVFTREPSNPNSYGYLDTTDLMGVIVSSGYVEYSSELNKLYILGQDTSYKVHLVELDIPPLWDYANDGSWLPNIASDGVPAWIRAKNAEDA